jgi:hypothetical protein
MVIFTIYQASSLQSVVPELAALTSLKKSKFSDPTPDPLNQKLRRGDRQYSAALQVTLVHAEV